MVRPDPLVDIDTWRERWGVGFAAAAVVGPEGIRQARGRTDHLVRIASVTKPLLAMAILVAIEEGTLRLDQPCGPPGSTIRHLLAHAGGYGFNGENVLAAPGTRRIYSNTGFERLGAALADASGMSAAEYVRAAVFEPLGMAMTQLRGSSAKDVWSCVDDLARFARELLRPTLLAPGTMADFTAVQFPALAGVLPDVARFDPNPWGLGVEIRGSKHPHWTGHSNSPATFGHFGGTGTFLWVDPAADVSLVCLTNLEFGPWALAAWPALSDAVLSG